MILQSATLGSTKVTMSIIECMSSEFDPPV